MMNRISVCEALAKRNEINPFLKRMVTGEKKWVTYDNTVQKRSWSNGSPAQGGPWPSQEAYSRPAFLPVFSNS
ncbi:hypothetical protein TNCV_527311 [Trichonephila clavipes]|nr:hypothetical protein TNCV_527311 [Trichonephila clavipes]